MTSMNVTIVTGANGALGAAVVEQRVAAGDRVIALARSKSGQADMTRVSANLLQVQANTADPVALRSALERAEAEVGALTGAVLTAGAWRGGAKFTEPRAADDFRFVMDANLESANNALRAILPGLVQRKRGSVVLIGSRSG